MTRQQIGRIHRLLRRRARLRQSDVSEQSGVSRRKIGRLERGQLGQLCVDELERCFAALGADLRVTVLRSGADLERLLDEGHAHLVGRVVELLKALGWQVELEVSFSHFGDRGSIDILAWHPATWTLLVIEVKTAFAGLDPLLRPLDVKVRLAAKVAKDRFGWRPNLVARLVVMPEDRTIRRQVDRHAAALAAALPHRSREVRRWLREPCGALQGCGS